jgi:hypothetical protein
MTDTTVIQRSRRRPRCSVASIALPDGDALIPRTKFAEETIGISDRTARRLNLPTVYISGVAYVRRDASLKIIADSATRKNQPQRRRRA